MRTTKLLFISRVLARQLQNMVFEVARPLSISSKLKNIVSEKPELNGLDTYERAISTLNTLQSNASTIAQSVAHRRQNNFQSNQVQETEKFLKRSGLDYSDLDRLSVIHVSGTKGKVIGSALEAFH